MLVLSRRIGETIRIGADIEITISDVRGSNVRVAISAPRDVAILRGELAEAPLQPAELPQKPVAARRRKSAATADAPAVPAIAH